MDSATKIAIEDTCNGQKWPGPSIPTVLSLWLELPGMMAAKVCKVLSTVPGPK